VRYKDSLAISGRRVEMSKQLITVASVLLPNSHAQFSMQGNSAASAIVAGCAALVKEKTGHAGSQLKDTLDPERAAARIAELRGGDVVLLAARA
jgi:hypothetical protein